MLNILEKVVPLVATLHKAHVIKDFFIYSCGSVFIRALSFIMVPFLMRILTPSDYGAFALVTAFIAIGSALLGLGLRQFLSIEYFHRDTNAQKELINELLIIYTCCAVFVISLLWHLRQFILTYIFFNAITPFTLGGTFISLFLFFFTELLYQVLQYERQSKQLILLQISSASLLFLSTIYTVWFLQWGISGVIWSQAIGQCFTTAIGIYVYASYYLSSSLSQMPRKAFSYIKQGAPFIPGIMSSWLLASGDRWMLGYYYSTYEVGIYAIADLFAQLFNTLVLVPWAGSYLPYILQTYKQHPDTLEGVEQHNQRTMWTTLFLTTVIISIGYLSCKPLVYWLLPPAYHEAWHYVWLLLMGQVFLLGSYFASALIQFKKKTYLLAFALFIPALLNSILNFILISHGILGCTVATFFSYLAYFCLLYFYKNNVLIT